MKNFICLLLSLSSFMPVTHAQDIGATQSGGGMIETNLTPSEIALKRSKLISVKNRPDVTLSGCSLSFDGQRVDCADGRVFSLEKSIDNSSRSDTQKVQETDSSPGHKNPLLLQNKQ